MTNLASALKSEITRLTRKELRASAEQLKKVINAQRVDLAALRRQVAELEKSHQALARIVDKALRSKPSPAPAAASSGQAAQAAQSMPLRFRAAGMAANRERLGLSAADFGLLIAASAASVRDWEEGKSKPSRSDLIAISAVRGIGKREAAARLAALKKTG